MERNDIPPERGESPLSAARRQRRRTRSRKKKRSARVEAALDNIGWVILAVALGVPVMAGLLYLAGL